jgi:hypothetical protein
MIPIPKITLIIPYFGKFPEISKLFFLTCRYNSNLHFLLLCDQKKPANLPPNVEYIYFTLKDFCKLASQKLGIKITIRFPYKLCDFKPMYGIIFEEYLERSTFWGYCDVDMIFGNTTDFLNTNIFTNYEIITSRKETLSGNFTLYKNSERLNNLYLQSDCWKQIVKNPWYVFSFPEKFKPAGKPVSGNLFYRLMKIIYRPQLKNTNVPDMNAIICLHPEISVHYGNFMLSDMLLKNRDISKWEMDWEKGELTEKISGRKYLYFHFYFLKNKKNYILPGKIDFKKVNSIQITSESVLVK